MPSLALAFGESICTGKECCHCLDTGTELIFCAPRYYCPACICREGRAIQLSRQLDIVSLEDLYCHECGEHKWGVLDQLKVLPGDWGSPKKARWGTW